jgi:hypothetical protein
VRDLFELNINEGGKSVGRPAPTKELVREFEVKFAVKLAEDYLALLRHSNGGGSELDTIQPIDKRDVGRWSVNRYYYLDEHKNRAENLWRKTVHWRPNLGQKAIPFAENGGGDKFFLDLSSSPPSVKVCIHDDQFKIIDIASSFEAFIDGLGLDPDTI